MSDLTPSRIVSAGDGLTSPNRIDIVCRLCPEKDQRIAGLESEIARQASLASLKREMEEKDEKLANFRDWIKAANKFMWAHEYDCPRRDGGASTCICGLDEFLCRPRPVVQGFRDEVAALRAQLDAAQRLSDKTADRHWIRGAQYGMGTFPGEVLAAIAARQRDLVDDAARSKGSTQEDK